MASVSDSAVAAAHEAREALRQLNFPSPADYTYHPLDYAWEAHRIYLERYAASGDRSVLFLGMNPGPFGMSQTGVPFGEVAVVRDWLGINVPVGSPSKEHPRKRVLGFSCPRSEVSGRRLWGLFQERFGKPETFFEGHTVHNYCPLLFLENTPTGRNVTPEELPAEAMRPVESACNQLLRDLTRILKVKTVVGVGGYAEAKARQALEGLNVGFARVLHPSPASPAANRGWSAAATKELVTQGIWSTRT